MLDVVGRAHLARPPPGLRGRAVAGMTSRRWPGASTADDIANEEAHDVKVAVLMGSPNDQDKMQPAADTLERFGIEADVRVLSAHRTPAEVAELASAARERATRLHLRRRDGGPPRRRGGAHTTLPVVGVPLSAAPSTASTRSTPPCRCPRASRWRPWPSTAPERRAARRPDAGDHRRRPGRSSRPPAEIAG